MWPRMGKLGTKNKQANKHSRKNQKYVHQDSKSGFSNQQESRKIIKKIAKYRPKKNVVCCFFCNKSFAALKGGLSPVKKILKIKIKIPLSRQHIRVHYPKILQDLVEN